MLRPGLHHACQLNIKFAKCFATERTFKDAFNDTEVLASRSVLRTLPLPLLNYGH